MLQTKPLQDLLSQALSSDIQIALLATRQGTLIAHALNLSSNSSSSSIETRRRQARSLAAISNVIWKNYANIKNIDELWDSHSGEANGQPTVEPKQSLLWTAVDCEVTTVANTQLTAGWKDSLISGSTTVGQGITTCSFRNKRCPYRNDACKGDFFARF
jgi:hypothetical protein